MMKKNVVMMGGDDTYLEAVWEMIKGVIAIDACADLFFEGDWDIIRWRSRGMNFAE